jgi:hypothetical protein
MSFRGGSRLFMAGLCAALTVLGACKIFKSTCDEDDRSCFGGGLARAGEACIRSGDCALGMACRESLCEYDGSTSRGGQCVVSAECAAGTYCSSKLKCTPFASPPGTAGVACADSSGCGTGLVCDLDLADAMSSGPFAMLSDNCQSEVAQLETSAACALPKTCTKRGKRDFGDACSENVNCLPGLYCALSPIAEDDQTTCLGGLSLPEELLSVPTWAGEKCPAESDSPAAYFDLAAGIDADSDFYRLPFPNDIRRTPSGIDLNGHPAPPASLRPPVAARFVEDAAKQRGFSTNPVVYFRFSTAYDSSQLSLSSVRIVDVTPDSPDYNANSTIAWGGPERESHYACDHWLSLHRPVGTPLRPNTTYAAIVTRRLRTKEGAEFARSGVMDQLLSATRPSGGRLATAWDAYAPLRKWVDDPAAEFKTDEILNATVFTTGNPQAIVPALKTAVQAEGGPALKSLTVCSAGVTSPCADETGRGACHPVSADFTEIHGKLSIPIFQAGTPPYEQPESGGDIELSDDGRARVVRREDVCFALSVPVKAAPAAGYPLLVYAYAVGGAFQEAMAADGLAGEVARGPSPAAVLSIELPQHGARRGGSGRPPQDLFANFQNPAAMRGNVLQGAADLWSAVALARIGILSPVRGEPIRFDPARLALFAQGQGATHAAIALSADEDIRAVVLAGLSGHFATTQLLRTKPASMAALLPLLLVDMDSEGKLAGGIFNPMLSLLQSSLDSVDPVNYANKLFKIGPNRGRDVFVVYGRDDHFSPESAQEAYAKAARLAAVPPDLSNRFEDLPGPVTHNQNIGDDQRTVALRQYDPSTDPIHAGTPEDGHFVVQGSKAAHADVVRFLTQALAGQPPAIGGE